MRNNEEFWKGAYFGITIIGIYMILMIMAIFATLK